MITCLYRSAFRHANDHSPSKSKASSYLRFRSTDPAAGLTIPSVFATRCPHISRRYFAVIVAAGKVSSEPMEWCQGDTRTASTLPLANSIIRRGSTRSRSPIGRIRRSAVRGGPSSQINPKLTSCFSSPSSQTSRHMTVCRSLRCPLDNATIAVGWSLAALRGERCASNITLRGRQILMRTLFKSGQDRRL